MRIFLRYDRLYGKPATLFAVLAFFALLYTHCSAQPPPLSQTKVTMMLDWLPAAEQGGYFCALVNGFYKKAGLDVTIRPANPGGASGGLLLFSGQIQFAMGTSDGVILSRAHGLPVVAVMATMEHDPKAIMVHADSGIKSFADLEGHKLSVLPGNPWYLYVTKKYHLHHIQQVPVSMSCSIFMVDPTYSQECFLTSEPFFVQSHGVKALTLPVKDTGYDICRVLMTTDDFVAKRRDVVQAFVDASILGWKTYLQEPVNGPTDQEILKRNHEMFQEQITFSKRVMVDQQFVTGDPAKGEEMGKLSVERFATTYQILHDLNIIGEIDYTKALDTEFTQKK